MSVDRIKKVDALILASQWGKIVSWVAERHRRRKPKVKKRTGESVERKRREKIVTR